MIPNDSESSIILLRDKNSFQTFEYISKNIPGGLPEQIILLIKIVVTHKSNRQKEIKLKFTVAVNTISAK